MTSRPMARLVVLREACVLVCLDLPTLGAALCNVALLYRLAAQVISRGP